MSRDSSPPPLSDDSAVGSLSSSVANSENSARFPRADRNVTTQTPQQVCQQSQQVPQANQQPLQASKTPQQQQEPTKQQIRPKVTRPSAKDLKVNSDDLELAAKQMRNNNVGLISRSIRTVLSCFDDLDIQRFESRTDYLINFISNGINKCSSSILRPVSILWPEYYEKMVEQLAILDAFLLNTEFREKPVDWMLKRGLTTIPNCRQCKDKMVLKYEDNIVRWQCQKTQACSNYFMPVQRPSFFSSYENVGLDKLLFSVYFWSTCTPGEELYKQMNIEPHILDGLWRRIQNVCRTALEKSYPRHRLTNVVDQGPDSNSPAQPIDLVSIKLNDVYVVGAKHPGSNLVRLGLYIPNVSLYSFVDLTESWFAHGAHIRVSENKFLDLSQRRNDLKVELVSRLEMIAKDGHFYRDSAFGYLICQLSHVLKDFDSSSLSRESLKLILAEMQWREQYGTTPFDAFTNIVNHMAQYGEASDWYSEPSLPVEGEETFDKADDYVGQSLDGTDYVLAEKYFYATVDPVDSEGKVICRFTEPTNLENPPQADVRIQCHECNLRFESFDFSIHMIAHVEKNRREFERKEYLKKKLIECKHCFKTFEREHITMHSTLFRTHLHMVKYGCRICCIRLNDRAEYLQHMRRLHFEHETPYHCPSCKFASSFQRDIFIHFQEEHRHSMIILCPLCLRSFTVAKPELMTTNKMCELSKIIYNHLAEHYVLSKGYTCSNCCLCFLDKDKLLAHKQSHHNPLEIRSANQVKVESFLVTPEEEKYCIKALPMELFIANKRPNLALDPVSRPTMTKSNWPKKRRRGVRRDSSSSSGSSSSNSDDEEPDDNSSTGKQNKRSGTENDNDDDDDDEEDGTSTCDDSDDDSYCTANGDDGTIHVRGLSEAKRFLDGGGPSLHVPKARSVSSGKASSSKHAEPSDYSSQKLIDYLSKMKRADGIIPNQSVILTPKGTPAKCCECFQYVTVDHFVAPIVCKDCKYITHCPRAATKHNITKHNYSID